MGNCGKEGVLTHLKIQGAKKLSISKMLLILEQCLYFTPLDSFRPNVYLLGLLINKDRQMAFLNSTDTVKLKKMEALELTCISVTEILKKEELLKGLLPLDCYIPHPDGGARWQHQRFKFGQEKIAIGNSRPGQICRGDTRPPSSLHAPLARHRSRCVQCSDDQRN